jgi:4-amino-4-deoxy-L-arabinose transferase-like glycosyltransferase
MKSLAGHAGGWPLLLLTCAFLSRGVFFALALPSGDPHDESFHFAYACFLAQTGRVPAASEPSIPVEIGRAVAALPASGAVSAVGWSEYSRLQAEQREKLRRIAYEFRPAERDSFFAPNYETQQPPLFYAMGVLLLELLPSARFSTRLLTVRLLSAFLAALAVPFLYRFLRRVLPKRPALAATAACVAFPGLGIFAGRFTNDALALPLAGALLGLFVETARGRLSRGRAIALAALLAVGLWTKLYFLLFLPAGILISLLASRGKTVRRSILAAVLALLVFVPWALRQKSQTGDWLGLLPSKQATALSIGLPGRLAAFPDLLTARFAIVFGRTFLWPGTRSASGAPAAVAVALTATLLALLIGPALSGVRRSRIRMKSWWAGGIAVAAFVVGQLAYASTYAAIGRARGHPPVAGPDGWYLLLLFPVVLTAACAFGHATQARSFHLASAVFLAAEGLMTFGVLPGVYGGRTSFNGANVSLAVYGSQLLRPAESLRVYGRVGLAAVPPGMLAVLIAVWLLILGGGVLASRRFSLGLGGRRA